MLFNSIAIVSDVNDCSSNPCMNGGHCIDLKDNFQCQCKEGFWGKFCELEVDNCALQPCKNNGTCINKVFNNRRSFYFCCWFGLFLSISVKNKLRLQLKKYQMNNPLTSVQPMGLQQIIIEFNRYNRFNKWFNTTMISLR